MSSPLKIVRPFDALLVLFLVIVGFMTYSAERPPRPELPLVITRMQVRTDTLITSVFTPPVSTWVSGLLLGDDRAFSREWKDAFRRTGTSHLTAVSGYNIAVLISILGTASSRLPISRRMRIVLGAMVVILFVLMTGAPASVIRAAGMSAIVVIARLFGRSVKTVRVLMLALTAMVAFQPELLLHDLGFQLSALATFGLVVFTPPIQVWVGKYLPRMLAEPIAQTVAATVTVSPLIALVFGTFSLITLPANVVVGMAVPFMMAASLVMLLIGMASLALAQILTSLLGVVFMLPLHFIRIAAGVPHAELIGSQAFGASLFLSLVVLALSLLHQRRSIYVETH